MKSWRSFQATEKWEMKMIESKLTLFSFKSRNLSWILTVWGVMKSSVASLNVRRHCVGYWKPISRVNISSNNKNSLEKIAHLQGVWKEVPKTVFEFINIRKLLISCPTISKRPFLLLKQTSWRSLQEGSFFPESWCHSPCLDIYFLNDVPRRYFVK